MQYPNKKNKKLSFVFLLFIITITLNFIFLQNPKAEATGGCGVDCWQQDSTTCKIDHTVLGNWEVCTINQPMRQSNISGGPGCDEGFATTSKWCRQTTCPAGAKGVFTLNGARCDIMQSEVDVIWPSCRVPYSIANGNWDASEGKCIFCFDKMEQRIYGDTSGISTVDGDDECDSACGADFDCDEKANNAFFDFCISCDASDTGSHCMAYCGKDADCDYDRVCQKGIVLNCGASAACADKKVGEACTGGTCDSSCECVSDAINITANPSTIIVSTATDIEFTTTVAAVATSGVLVTITGPGINANCTTIASGKCTVNVTASAVGTASVSATKVPLTAGSTSVTINAALACPGGFEAEFSKSGSYNVGEEFEVDLMIGNPIGTYGFHNGCAALYNPSNTKVWEFTNTNGLYGNTPTGINATAGTWKVTIMDGTTCDINSTCYESTTVVGVGPGPGVCSSTACGAANVTPCACGGTALTGADVWCGFTPLCNPGQGFTTQAACQAACVGGPGPGVEICTGGADEDGDGDVDCADSDCAADPACAGGGGSACDNKVWFFCNPLRGTIEDIFQAGETLIGYILGLIGSIALLLIIIAGVMYMTSMGNEEKITKSKKIITGAVIGLAIALLSYSLLQLVLSIL